MSKKDLFLFSIFSYLFVFIFTSGILHWLNYWLNLDLLKFSEVVGIFSIIYSIAVSIYFIRKGVNK